MLSRLSQKACKRLREAGLSARTLTLTIRYAGFDTYTRSKTPAEPVQFDADAFAQFLTLFREHRNIKRKIRLLGVAFSGLTHGNAQLDLLDPQRRAKLEKLSKAADSLRDRFGFGKVQFGGSLLAEKPERENEQGEIPRFPRSKE
jgi:DNA polymerase-4